MMDPTALFWTKIAAIGQVAGAVATFLAAFIALHLARSERRIRLRVTAQLMRIVAVTGATDTVSVTVQNLGYRVAKIDSLGWMGGIPSWSLPKALRWLVPTWLAQESLFQIHDYAWGINENFPWRLEPGESKSTHFRREEFFNEFTVKQGATFFRKIPFTKRFVAVRPRVFVGVDTERIKTGLIAKSLLEEMRKAFERGLDA